MADQVDYEIYGDDLQFVEIILDPGEAAIAEAGSMMYMDDGIQMSTSLSDGSEKNSGILGAMIGLGKRALTGESLFVTFFTNKGKKKARVAFSSPFPGKIIPIELPKIGGTLMCQKGAFLAAAKGVAINVGLTKKIGSGLFGGEGFILQKLEGKGNAFIHAGGTIVEQNLPAGQTIYVDTGSLVAFQPSVDFDIQMVKGVQSIFFGGEGFFLSKLTGPGKIWIQSMPFTRLMSTINSNIEEKQEKNKK